jgi:hypothetical protein
MCWLARRAQASHSKDGRHGFTFTLTDAAGKEITCALPNPKERDLWISKLEAAARGAIRAQEVVSMDQMRQQAFRDIDKDGDGHVEFHEFCRMEQVRGMEAAEVRALFESLDVNKDGTLSRNEILRAFQNEAFMQRHARARPQGRAGAHMLQPHLHPNPQPHLQPQQATATSSSSQRALTAPAPAAVTSSSRRAQNGGVSGTLGTVSSAPGAAAEAAARQPRSAGARDGNRPTTSGGGRSPAGGKNGKESRSARSGSRPDAMDPASAERGQPAGGGKEGAGRGEAGNHSAREGRRSQHNHDGREETGIPSSSVGPDSARAMRRREGSVSTRTAEGSRGGVSSRLSSVSRQQQHKPAGAARERGTKSSSKPLPDVRPDHTGTRIANPSSSDGKDRRRRTESRTRRQDGSEGGKADQEALAGHSRERDRRRRAQPASEEMVAI